MRRVHITWVFAVLIAPLAGTPAASAGEVYHVAKELRPYPDAAAFEYGAAVALAGDLAIVGDRRYDGVSGGTGAAFITRATGGDWIQQAFLLASDGLDGDEFGYSVALDSAAGLAVVGAVEDDDLGLASGSAYVFRFNGAAWVQEQKLTAGDGAFTDRFGNAVAVSGNTIMVGAYMDDDLGNGSGSVYVFTFNGTAWSQTQKLLAADGTASDQFGASVSLENNVAFIGALLAPPSSSGAVYVFGLNGANWQQQQKLSPASATPLARFGASVDVTGDLAIVGAPHDDEFGAFSGSAHVYRFDGAQWAFEQRLVSPEGAATTQFGFTVAAAGANVVVGSGPAAKAYLFNHDGSTWLPTQQLLACDENVNSVRSAVAASGANILVGVPAGLLNQSAFIFSPALVDCNSNGNSDACDLTSATDCNANARLDSCEIASGTTGDCNLNGAPDECEATVAYRLDNGNPAFVAGFAGNKYILWLNQFNVVAGAQTITHVALPWVWGPEGHSATILIYDDPNKDGNPNDAVLLSSVNTTSTRVGPEIGLGGWPVAIIATPPTPVGEVGDSFFVGAIVNSHFGQSMYPAALENTAPHLQRSWRAVGAAGTANLADLAANPVPLQVVTSGDFMVRALALDCNGNGAWDQCDIASGASADANANGIPDECEDLCPADITNDGAVDVNDLLLVVGNWGAMGANVADVNGDLVVNVNDLLAVIGAWGPCQG